MSTFPEKTSEKLGQLLRMSATGKLVTTEHRKVLAQICDEARQSGMPVERLVVILKSVLDQAPHSEDSVHSRAEIKERLVAVCIEEYFRDGNAAN